MFRPALPAGGTSSKVHEGELEACAIFRVGNMRAVSIVFQLARLAHAVQYGLSPRVG